MPARADHGHHAPESDAAAADRRGDPHAVAVNAQLLRRVRL
jgi:hypothetical protein